MLVVTAIVKSDLYPLGRCPCHPKRQQTKRREIIFLVLAGLCACLKFRNFFGQLLGQLLGVVAPPIFFLLITFCVVFIVSVNFFDFFLIFKNTFYFILLVCCACFILFLLDRLFMLFLLAYFFLCNKKRGKK